VDRSTSREWVGPVGTMPATETTGLLDRGMAKTTSSSFSNSRRMGWLGAGADLRHLEDWRAKSSDDFIVLASVALVALLLAVVVNETLWYSAVGFETMDNGITTILKILILSLSVISFYFLYNYYNTLLEIQRMQGIELDAGFSLVSLYESRLLGQFIIDLIVLIPQPIPFIHFTVLVEDLHHEGHDALYT
jgi:hypothetical protein